MEYNNLKDEIVLKRQELLATSINLTRNRQDAEDLVQDTMLKAYKNIGKFRPGTNLNAWLYTIMRNSFINELKKKNKTTIINPQNDSDSLRAIFGVDLTVNSTYDDLNYEFIMKNLDDVNEPLSEAFLMYYNGYRYKEIAELLHIPMNTVKSRIRKCRIDLIDKLKESYPDRAVNISI